MNEQRPAPEPTSQTKEIKIPRQAYVVTLGVATALLSQALPGESADMLPYIFGAGGAFVSRMREGYTKTDQRRAEGVDPQDNKEYMKAWGLGIADMAVGALAAYMTNGLVANSGEIATLVDQNVVQTEAFQHALVISEATLAGVPVVMKEAADLAMEVLKEVMVRALQVAGVGGIAYGAYQNRERLTRPFRRAGSALVRSVVRLGMGIGGSFNRNVVKPVGETAHTNKMRLLSARLGMADALRFVANMIGPGEENTQQVMAWRVRPELTRNQTNDQE